MSEFISACPLCHQRILCDTEYAGKRVACPVCMQEINMPEPPSKPAGSAHSPATATTGATPDQTRKFPVAVAAAVIVVTLLMVTIGIFVLGKRHPSPEPAPPVPVASVSPSPSEASASPASEPPRSDSTGTAQPQALLPGQYIIANHLTGFCLDVNTLNTNEGPKVVLGRYNGTQIWNVQACGDDRYSLRLLRGLNLQLPGSKKTGMQLELAKWLHLPRQQWSITPTTGGYEITGVAGQAVSILDGTDLGQPVVQDLSPQGGINQRWTFTRVGVQTEPAGRVQMTFTPANTDFNIDTTADLILGDCGTVVSGSFWNLYGGGLTNTEALKALTDGNAPANGVEQGAGVRSGLVLEYKLRSLQNVVSNIVICSGWVNDGRVDQTFNLSYSCDGTNFTPWVKVAKTFVAAGGSGAPTGGDSGGPCGLKTTLSAADGGVLFSDLAALRIAFVSPENGGVAYTEIAVGGRFFPMP